MHNSTKNACQMEGTMSTHAMNQDNEPFRKTSEALAWDRFGSSLVLLVGFANFPMRTWQMDVRTGCVHMYDSSNAEDVIRPSS